MPGYARPRRIGACLRQQPGAAWDELRVWLAAPGAPDVGRATLGQAVQALDGWPKKGVHATERGTKRVIALRDTLVETLQTQDFTCFKFVDVMRTAHFVLAPTGPIAVVTPAPRAGSTPPRPRPCTAGRT